MARVTIQDCLLRVQDCFELTVLAAHRARQLSAGAPLTIPRNNDRDHVLALREIAKGTVDVAELRMSLLKGFQRYVEAHDGEEDFIDAPSTRPSLEVAASSGVLDEC